MIHIAKKASTHSNYKHRLGCVIVKSGRILATGYNMVGHKSTYGKWPDSLHAEEMAILKLMKPSLFHHLQGAKLYITRTRKNGKLATAKPCNKCMQLIISVGIREIIYSTNETIVKEKTC